MSKRKTPKECIYCKQSDKGFTEKLWMWVCKACGKCFAKGLYEETKFSGHMTKRLGMTDDIDWSDVADATWSEYVQDSNLEEIDQLKALLSIGLKLTRELADDDSGQYSKWVEKVKEALE